MKTAVAEPPPEPVPLAGNIIGQRAATLVDEGPFAGTYAVVDQIVAWPVYTVAIARIKAFIDAATAADEITTLRSMYEWYVGQARPAWNIEEPRGPVPPTTVGMLRLPVPLARLLYELWLETFPSDEPDAPVAEV